MPAYRDIVNGATVVADPYRVKEVDGVAYEVECKTIYKRDETYTFDARDASLDPIEAAEEAAAADHESPTRATTDLQEEFHYEPIYFQDKRDYGIYFKSWAGAVARKMKEQGKSQSEFETWRHQISSYYRSRLLANFDNFDCFTCGPKTGTDKHTNSMVILKDIRDDGMTPFVIILKHGLEEAST